MANHPIRLVAGLGNPGQAYQRTRHNLGHHCVTQWCESLGGQWKNHTALQSVIASVLVDGQRCHLVKPITYMNLSGHAIQRVMHYHRIEPAATLIIHDDLDIPVGQVRLKWGGGHGGHNGLRHIIQMIGGAPFHRLRIGIGRPAQHTATEHYVLQPPQSHDHTLIEQALADTLPWISTILSGQQDQAMQQLHGST